MKNKYNTIGICFFLGIGVLPFVAALGYAVLYSLGIVGAANTGFTTRFWQTVMESGTFFTSFAYSGAIAFVSVVLSVGGALWIVIKFRKELEGKFWSFLSYIPLAIPGVVTGFFTFQVFAKGGLFSRFSYQFGWISEAAQFPDLVNDTWAIGITFSFITLVLPFFVLLFLQVFKNERIEELSLLGYTLGATQKQVTYRIVIPILLQRTRVLLALYFIFLLGAYEVPLILGQESPQMLSVFIIQEIKQYDLDKISEGYVVAVLYTLTIAVAAVLLFMPKRKSTYEA